MFSHLPPESLKHCSRANAEWKTLQECVDPEFGESGPFNRDFVRWAGQRDGLGTASVSVDRQLETERFRRNPIFRSPRPGTTRFQIH